MTTNASTLFKYLYVVSDKMTNKIHGVFGLRAEARVCARAQSNARIRRYVSTDWIR